jgi:hypothetical protein
MVIQSSISSPESAESVYVFRGVTILKQYLLREGEVAVHVHVHAQAQAQKVEVAAVLALLCGLEHARRADVQIEARGAAFSLLAVFLALVHVQHPVLCEGKR